MDLERLQYMADQIARNFAIQGEAFAVEATAQHIRDFWDPRMKAAIKGADRSREVIRFDCFDRFPHYHYILNETQNNVVWGYDPDANGPMLEWSFASIRRRLPAFLRRAGEAALAEQVEREGLDTGAIDRLRQAIDSWEPSLPSDEALAEGKAWYERWMQVHPQFNTAAGQVFL